MWHIHTPSEYSSQISTTHEENGYKYWPEVTGGSGPTIRSRKTGRTTVSSHWRVIFETISQIKEEYLFYILIKNIPDIMIIQKLEPNIYHFRCKHNLSAVRLFVNNCWGHKSIKKQDRKNLLSTLVIDVIWWMGDFWPCVNYQEGRIFSSKI